jgi:DNA-binding LacI/PurR family transcriptional regulator
MLLLRQLDEAEIRRIAVEADADPRTVKRVIRDQPVQRMTADRITRALRKLGLVVEQGTKR